MSNYGPSGGPYRDQPQDPWQGRPPQEQYEQPSDPWGGQDQWGGSPPANSPGATGSPTPGYGAEQPTYGYGGYDQAYGYGGEPGYQQAGPYQGEPGYGQQAGPPDSPPPAWGAPAPLAPPRRRRPSAGVVALLTVLAVLVVGGVGFAAWKLSGKEGAQANPDAVASATPTPTASGPTGAPSPSGGSPNDARLATEGQCLVNKGSNKRPEIRLVDCGKGTADEPQFEVLARYDGTADFKTRCGKVKGYTDHYFYDSAVDSADFVLCLKRQG